MEYKYFMTSDLGGGGQTVSRLPRYLKEIQKLGKVNIGILLNYHYLAFFEKTGQKKRTIAIVNKSNYNLLQDSLNIDDLVDPRMTTVSRIMEHVHKGTIGTVYSLLDGEYEFIEAKILEKSELLNKKIRDSNLPEDIRIGAIVRKDKVIIPRSNFIFEKDDLVVFLAKREQLKAVENIFSVGSI